MQVSAKSPDFNPGIWLKQLLRDKNLTIGITLFLLAAGLGYSAMLYSSFGDEGDSIAAAMFISKGLVLYRDIFSHHFPFVYCWIALFFKLIHPSIRVARFSILVFQLLTFFVMMLVTRRYKTIGLVAVLWSSIGFLYFANMALYQSVIAMACLPLFMIPLLAILQHKAPSLTEAILLGVCASIALLTNPLAAFPIATASLFLILNRINRRRMVVTTLVFTACMGLFLLYLSYTHSLGDFYQSAILFNLQVYPKYNSAADIPGNFLNTIASGLYLFGTGRPMFPYDLSGSFTQTTIFLLSGTVSRLIVLLTCLGLLIKRKFLAAGFVFLFAAGILIRQYTNFDNLSFTLISLTMLAFSSMLPWEADLIRIKTGPEKTERNTWKLALSKQAFLTAVFSLLICLWFVSEGIIFRFNSQEDFNYAANFSTYLKESKKITLLACGQPVKLGYYPEGSYYYFFTGMQPVSKYIYLWPWVAEVGLNDILMSLKEDANVVVYIDKGGSVWGLANQKYLAPLIDYVEEEYIDAGNSYYISPGLQGACKEALK
jgi:hypothetical protein